MKSALVAIVCLLSLNTNALAISVKWEKWFDTRAYYLQIIEAKSRRGETVTSMVCRTKGVAGVNGSYFGRTSVNGRKELFPIGYISFCSDNLTRCSAPSSRGYIWQTDRTGVGFHPPRKTIFTLQAGPVLIVNGRLVRDRQSFSKRHWNRKTLRTIVALKDNKVYLMKIEGNLWDISKYLVKKRHMSSATSVDGGSSSARGAKVPNGLIVFSKKRPFYINYHKNNLKKNWLKNLREPSF